MGRSPGTGLSRRIINGKRRDRAHHKKHSGPLWNLDKLQDRVDRWSDKNPYLSIAISLTVLAALFLGIVKVFFFGGSLMHAIHGAPSNATNSTAPEGT